MKCKETGRGKNGSSIRLREFAKIQEEERRIIAQEIHDRTINTLVAIKYFLEGKMNNPEDYITLQEVVSITQNCIDDTRRIISRLRPSILDDLGVLPAISWYIREYQTIYSGILVEQDIAIREHEIPNSLKSIIFRVLQEALSSLAKHRPRDLIKVGITKDKAIKMVLSGDGRAVALNNGLLADLKNISDRVYLANGKIRVRTRDGIGTYISIEWPGTFDHGYPPQKSFAGGQVKHFGSRRANKRADQPARQSA